MALAATLLFSLLLGGGAWFSIHQDRQQRSGAANQQVHEAFTEAVRLREQARSAPADSLAPWVAAREMVRRAATLTENGLVDPTLAAQVGELLVEIEDEVTVRQFVSHLDEVRFHHAEVGLQKNGYPGPTAADFAESFRTSGVAAGETDPRHVAALIRQRPEPIREALLVAFEEWQFVCTPAQGDDKHWLDEVIRALEPDPWLTRLSAAAAREDLRSAFRLLGAAFAAKGRAAEALAAYRQVLFLNPDRAQAHFNLARALTDLGFFTEAIPISRAAEMADLALNGTPAWAIPYAQFAKGLAEYRLGRFDSAQGWLQKSLKHAAPGWRHPLPHLVLAMIAHRNGQTDEACKRLAEADAMSKRLAEIDAMSPYELRDLNILGVWVSQILRREVQALIDPEPDCRWLFQP